MIVDEAHTFAFGATARGRHQRHELLQALGSDEHRHLILVTATPHSGKDDAFRSLLALLDPSLADLPEDLSGVTREADRRRLARHLVQRRRVDIGAYLDEQTPFPDRLSRDVTYELSNDMRAVLDDALEWARDIVRDEEQDRRRQRVRWWSALALLRSLGSSPAAAAATLRTRADNLIAQTVEEADELGRFAVMDDAGDEGPESLDSAPGALDEGGDARAGAERKRPLILAKAAENLAGAADTKLSGSDEARQGTRQRRQSADRLLPFHPDSRVRCRAPARRPRQEHRGRCNHGDARAVRAREPYRFAVLTRSARARRHRLPQRGNQPPGWL